MEQQPQQQRFCSYTFVSENEIFMNSDGARRLLRCTRCKDTYYIDQESQKAHWKVHKKVCKPLDVEERNRIFGLKAREVAVAMSHCFASPHTIVHFAAGRSFLYLLQRLEILCQEAEKNEKKHVGGGVLDAGGLSSMHMWEDPNAIEEGENEPGVIFTQLTNLMHIDSGSLELLWAIPGLTNYMLGHSLISDAMRKKQASGILPSRAESNSLYYDPEFHIHPVFCNLMGLFITFSAMKKVGGQDEVDFRRGTSVAVAAARRAMTWWSNP
jgi:MYND finger